MWNEFLFSGVHNSSSQIYINHLHIMLTTTPKHNATTSTHTRALISLCDAFGCLSIQRFVPFFFFFFNYRALLYSLEAAVSFVSNCYYQQFWQWSTSIYRERDQLVNEASFLLRFYILCARAISQRDLLFLWIEVLRAFSICTVKREILFLILFSERISY